ncbi:MAG: CSLREA domain-containing protein [Anaerolineales bacterium]|nr:CSLREA domain-containing protein [Anaerolineales bacterium]
MRPTRNSVSRHLPWCAIFLLALTVSCGGTPVPCDADIHVTKTADTNDGACTGADCSLREAVIRANICAGTQTILIPAGTYTLTRTGAMEDAAATGDLDITDNVTIWGTSPAVIDGNAADRVFDVHPGVTASLSTLVIQNGRAEYDGGGGIRSRGTLNLNESTVQNNIGVHPYLAAKLPDGGGILHESEGALGVYLSEIRNNNGFNGGGIAVLTWGHFSPSVIISYTEISENTADNEGGAVYLDVGVSASIVRFEAQDNTSGGNGGGIYNRGSLELEHATLEGNLAGFDGGGIYNTADGMSVSRQALLESNEARIGGGIYNLGMAHFYQSALVHNVAANGMGGGAYNGPGAGLRADNSTISSNTGAFGGGGVRNEEGDFQFMFVTIASNENEGIRASGSGEMTIRNTILSANTGGNCAGADPDSIGHNLDDGDSCALTEDTDLSTTNPMLNGLAMNGSFMPTHALLPGSPAIDSADPDRCAGADQRGVIRPQGAGCDRGAHEQETSGGGSALISGKVWHDLCAVPEHGYPPTPPPGCSDPDGDGHHTDANGILEPGEPGLPGVTLRLKSGTCAAGSDLMTAVTGSEGEYSFPALAAGTYCVSANALGDGNDLILIPGGWSYPAGDGALAQTEIVIGDGEVRPDIHFGWDFQFLPAWTEPDTTPTPTPATISFGKPTVSTDTLYFPAANTRAACGAREVQFQIGLSSTQGVANVLFFARLKEQSDGRIGAWSEGVSMTPIGNNQYVYTLQAEDLPEVRTFTEAWLQYQYVALDKAGQVIVRSEVFWNITLLRCAFK